MDIFAALFQGGVSNEKASAPVTLHIYDLAPSIVGVNAVLGAVGTGAFHAGVEVYGREWSFGCCGDGPYGSGIFYVPPRGCDAHCYREAVEMGITELSKREVDALIDKLCKEWPGRDYDLLRHNCCHFSDALCIHLGVGPVPSWVTSLAGVGAMLRSAVRIGVQGVELAVMLPVRGAGAVAGAFARAAQPQEPHQQMLPNTDAYGDKSRQVSRAGRHEEDSRQVSRAAAMGVQDKASDNPFHVLMPWLPGRDFNAGLRFDPPPRSEVMARQKAEAIAKIEAAQRLSKAEWSGMSPSDDANPLRVGDLVEVFSNSQQAWCPGYVDAISEDRATVAFQLPGAAPDELATKVIPIDHKDLRRAKSQVKAVQSRGGFAKGDPVEVFSNSKQAWCPGHVENVHGHMLRLAFMLPGETEFAHKDCPADHKDIRTGKPGVCSADEVPLGRQTSRRAHTEVADSTPRVVDPEGTLAVAEYPTDFTGEEDGLSGPTGGLIVSDWVEVFTNSHQAWCLGRVTRAEDDRVTVVFQLPGAGQDEWCEKRLHPNAKHLRRVNAEVLPAADSNIAKEALVYEQLLRELVPSAAGRPEDLQASDAVMTDYFRSSGLPRKALKELWQVGNPDGKGIFGIKDFSLCCRLIGHCQARVAEEPGFADVLIQGGEPLRAVLVGEFLFTPPPKMPDFNNPD